MEFNVFAMSLLILIVEAFILLFLGIAGTTILPQARVIGVPWSKSVRTASEEIRKERQRQVSFWVLVGIVDFILFIIALALPTV